MQFLRPRHRPTNYPFPRRFDDNHRASSFVGLSTEFQRFFSKFLSKGNIFPRFRFEEKKIIQIIVLEKKKRNIKSRVTFFGLNLGIENWKDIVYRLKSMMVKLRNDWEIEEEGILRGRNKRSRSRRNTKNLGNKSPMIMACIRRDLHNKCFVIIESSSHRPPISSIVAHERSPRYASSTPITNTIMRKGCEHELRVRGSNSLITGTPYIPYIQMQYTPSVNS